MGKSNKNKLKGQEFEQEVITSLSKRSFNKFRLSSNSGAKNNDADIRSEKFLIECKVKDTNDFKHSNKELKKLIKQANGLGKDWIYILKNNNNKIFTLISYDTFLDLIDQIEYLQKELNLLEEEISKYST